MTWCEGREGKLLWKRAMAFSKVEIMRISVMPDFWFWYLSVGWILSRLYLSNLCVGRTDTRNICYVMFLVPMDLISKL